MSKLCTYRLDGNISEKLTGERFAYRIEISGTTQKAVAKRMGISRGRLNELLNDSGRYRWSEEIARRIVKALKKK